MCDDIGNVNMTRILIENGADINNLKKDHNIALIVAIIRGIH